MFDASNFLVFCADYFIFLEFAVNVDTAAGAKPRELQILARFSPASVFLVTNILVSKVTVFLVLFTPFCKRGKSIFFFYGRNEWKIYNQLKRTALK